MQLLSTYAYVSVIVCVCVLRKNGILRHTVVRASASAVCITIAIT